MVKPLIQHGLHPIAPRTTLPGMTSQATPIAKTGDNPSTSCSGVPQTRQAKAVAKRSRAGQVTGALRVALDYMAFECETGDFASAAAHAGITAHAIRCAINKPHVKAYYDGLLQVLRTGERIRNVKRAIAIRDAAPNMPAMAAIKWLEGEQDQAHSGIRGGVAQSPGVTFVIVQGNAAPPMRDVGSNAGTRTTIDAKPSDISDIDG